MTGRSATAPVLETRRLYKNFGGLQVTHDVSLTLRPGARHALIGPNGAGKTTLVNLISGILKPSSGDVFLMGERITGMSEYKRVRRGLVRTFQINQLFRALSVIENIAMALAERDRAAGRVFRQMRADPARFDEAMTVLRDLNLESEAYSAISALPYGKLRLVEVGIALALRPRVLLLDEPVAGVSSSESHLITDAIAALLSEISVLIIEHNMDVVFRLADWITVLDAGGVLASAPPDEIAVNPEVRARYLGEREAMPVGESANG
jgi:ABC-type branched-subunit amino acid transport system ATPase component